MAGEATTTLVGNLVRDPELRYTGSGAAVCSFTVAQTPRILDKASGTWKDGPSLFMTCNVWRDAAENVAESLTKGARVVVTGSLRQRSYEKDGTKRTVVELEVDEVAPSLRYATVSIRRMERSSGSGSGGGGRAPSEDPWASQSSPYAQTAGADGRPFDNDPPPF